MVFKSLLGPIVFALIITSSTYPIYLYIDKKVGSKMNSSLISCLIITTVLIIPLSLIGIQLSKESFALYKIISSSLNEKSISDLLFGENLFAQTLKSILSPMGIDYGPKLVMSKIVPILNAGSTYIIKTFQSWAGDVVSMLFNFVVMIIVIYQIFSHGEALKRFVFDLSPLPEGQEQTLLERFNKMNYVTLVCNGIGAIMQSGLAVIGLWLCGIQSLVLWLTLMAILAFIPLVGISFVTIPAVIYLFAVGKVTSAIILFIYTTSVALIVENWWKPRFIGDKIEVNSMLVLLYIIGGMAAFGMAGIFYGPLLCILFLTFVQFYHDEYAVVLNQNE